MLKLAGMMLLLVGVSSLAMANVTVPEIHAGSASSALALISGAVLIIRSRKK